jgi:hypothetical protein
LFTSIEPAHDLADLPTMHGEHALDEPATRIGQGDAPAAPVPFFGHPRNEAGPFQPIDNPGHARRPDKQPPAQIRKPQAVLTLFIVRPLQVPQHTPLGTTDAEGGKVWLHNALEPAKGADQRAEGSFGGDGVWHRGSSEGAIHEDFISMLIVSILSNNNQADGRVK